MADPLYDEFMLWAPGSTSGNDDRARFTFINKGGGGHYHLFRDIQLDVVRDGTGDWIATHTEGGHTWTARSNDHVGAVLLMIARRCGLDGELHAAPEEDETP